LPSLNPQYQKMLGIFFDLNSKETMLVYVYHF